MKKLYATIGVVCVTVMLTGSAFGLEIQLGPRTLVLSSGGDQLTIHTDCPFGAVEGVTLDIGGATEVELEDTWADDCGNLVVRCTKETVAEAVGDFDDKFTEVDVTLTVAYKDGSAPDSATEILRVRK